IQVYFPQVFCTLYANQSKNNWRLMSDIDQIEPAQVHDILGKHILTDGYDIVLDLEKSQGCYLYDAKNDERYLDFFTFYASNSLSMNHPQLANKDCRKKIVDVDINKPSNSDVYTEEMAEFVKTFDRVGIPDYLPYSFFISCGALAVENALKVAFD